MSNHGMLPPKPSGSLWLCLSAETPFFPPTHSIYAKRGFPTFANASAPDLGGFGIDGRHLAATHANNMAVVGLSGSSFQVPLRRTNPKP